jgi:hypothetical protein
MPADQDFPVTVSYCVYDETEFQLQQIVLSATTALQAGRRTVIERAARIPDPSAPPASPDEPTYVYQGFERERVRAAMQDIAWRIEHLGDLWEQDEATPMRRDMRDMRDMREVDNPIALERAYASNGKGRV